jgi:2-oxo-3-hexenedioate decarboxylase
VTDILELAARIDRARLDRVPIPQLAEAESVDLDASYDVQRAGVELRQGRGESVVGVKLGFTSKAKAEQMGVSDVILGVITDEMQIGDGDAVDRGRFIHPRIEPEVAFLLGADLDPGAPADDQLAAVAQVAPALEIIDSRYRDFRFALEDVVADNTSAAGFVVGPWRELAAVRAELDLADLAVELEVDGAAAATGSTGDILGDPLHAVAAVVRMAGRYGVRVPAGSIILAGAATAAVPLPDRPGAEVVATVAGLGRVSVTIGDPGGTDG